MINLNVFLISKNLPFMGSTLFTWPTLTFFSLTFLQHWHFFAWCGTVIQTGDWNSSYFRQTLCLEVHMGSCSHWMFEFTLLNMCSTSLDSSWAEVTSTVTLYLKNLDLLLFHWRWVVGWFWPKKHRNKSSHSINFVLARKEIKSVMQVKQAMPEFLIWQAVSNISLIWVLCFNHIRG